MFKKYLNPGLKSQFISPSTTKNSMMKSMHFGGYEKKKVKAASKPKKIVNYTTIRKQVPSFERSVESIGSTIKILKYPKGSKDSSSSKSGSMLKYSNMSGNTSKNMTCKSISIHGKTLNNSKVIRLNKYMKEMRKKSKGKKEDVSKCEIDLTKNLVKNSSRRRRAGSKKETKPVLEETKTVSTLKSPSVKETDRLFPMSPERALKMFKNKGLTEYEQKEI